MYLSNESLLVILLVGLVAGWLASHIVQGTGLGLVTDMLLGVIGAFGVGTLLNRPFFAGSGRLLLLLLIPIAFLKWRGILGRR